MYRKDLIFALFATLLVLAAAGGGSNHGGGWGGGDDSDSDDFDCAEPVDKHSLYRLNLRTTTIKNNTINGWFNYAAGNYVANDGRVTIDRSGEDHLYIDTSRFTKTVPLDAMGGNDHPKNLQFYAQAQAVPAQGSLVCRATLSGQQVNVAVGQPYGAAVRDPNSDYRLATSSLVSIDLSLGMTADFFITNTKVWVLYERLPFARTSTYNYAAYTYVIPVANRQPTDIHDAWVQYDGTNQAIHWWLDGKRVYTVNRPGSLSASRNYLALDRCGTEEVVMPKNINCGLGTFTILDGFPGCPTTVTTPSGGKACTRASTDKALVQVEPSGYCDPLTGAPHPPPFVYDNAHGTGHTLYGQGATLSVYEFEIYTQAN